jgi:hypothetical protein
MLQTVMVTVACAAAIPVSQLVRSPSPSTHWPQPGGWEPVSGALAGSEHWQAAGNAARLGNRRRVEGRSYYQAHQWAAATRIGDCVARSEAAIAGLEGPWKSRSLRRICIVLPVMERGPTGRVTRTREERVFRVFRSERTARLHRADPLPSLCTDEAA